MATKRDESERNIAKARTARTEGDYKSARALAEAVLADPDASDSVKAEARAIVDSTRIAKPSIIAGVVMLVVLALLFAWVLTRPAH